MKIGINAFILWGIASIAVLISAEVTAQPTASTPFRDCPNCPELVWISPGEYQMGSTATDDWKDDSEIPQHSVKIAYRLAVGTHDITRGEYGNFLRETNRSQPGGCGLWNVMSYLVEDKWDWTNAIGFHGAKQDDSHPVVCVNLEDAKAYTMWLTQKTGKQYRIPSESEWEFLARGGTNSARYWGGARRDQVCKFANVQDQTLAMAIGMNMSPSRAREILDMCSDNFIFTSPVGSFPPNAFGIYDAIGNVWEMVTDCWHLNYSGAPADGSSWESANCHSHVIRGAGWETDPDDARVTVRVESNPSNRRSTVGFRVVRTD